MAWYNPRTWGRPAWAIRGRVFTGVAVLALIAVLAIVFVANNRDTVVVATTEPTSPTLPSDIGGSTQMVTSTSDVFDLLADITEKQEATNKHVETTMDKFGARLTTVEARVPADLLEWQKGVTADLARMPAEANLNAVHNRIEAVEKSMGERLERLEKLNTGTPVAGDIEKTLTERIVDECWEKNMGDKMIAQGLVTTDPDVPNNIDAFDPTQLDEVKKWCDAGGDYQLPFATSMNPAPAGATPPDGTTYDPTPAATPIQVGAVDVPVNWNGSSYSNCRAAQEQADMYGLKGPCPVQAAPEGCGTAGPSWGNVALNMSGVTCPETSTKGFSTLGQLLAMH